MLIASTVLLLLSAHLLSIGTRPEGRAAGPIAAVLEVLGPPELAITRLAQGGTSIFKDYFDLIGTRQENIQLRAELARLQTDRTRLAELEYENNRLGELLELKQALGMQAVAAPVIGSDATGLARTIVLGRGETSGVKTGMAVLSNQGVVGKVIAASLNAARVLLIEDHNSALDAIDQRSRARGILAGQVEGGLTMKYVERAQDVGVGDDVVTSGLDGIFPRGLLVGRVIRVERQGPGLFVNVEVVPAVEFRGLEQVLVLTEAPPKLPEQTQSKS